MTQAWTGGHLSGKCGPKSQNGGRMYEAIGVDHGRGPGRDGNGLMCVCNECFEVRCEVWGGVVDASGSGVCAGAGADEG